MRETIIKIALLTVLATASVVFLFIQTSRSQYSNDNGFFRKYPPHIIHNPEILDLGVNSYYICGATKEFIYLGNTTTPDWFLRINKNFKDTSKYRLNISSNDTIWGAATLLIDSPLVMMSQPQNPTVRTGDINHLNITSWKLKSNYMIDVAPVSSSSVIGKKLDIKSNKAVLFYESITNGIKTIPLSNSLDGVFTNDGFFLRQFGSPDFYYVNYYRNRFLRLDTNLNLLKTCHTIDTNLTTAIKLGKIKQATRLAMSGPAPYVNKSGFISEKYLFIRSAVKAENETDKSFKNRITIDAYNCNEGKYAFSFSLPLFKDHEFRSIILADDKIYAVYDRYLLSFKTYFSHLDADP